MSPINFITEARAKELIESEVESHRDKGFIIEPSGFSKHCMDTARIGHEVARKILEKHPSLKESVDPEIIRVHGYMHDFSKIYEGDKYHEVGTAHLILNEGDNLGLLTGGSKSERARMLKELAYLVLSDYALFEELGGNNFPEGALYKDCIDNFVERVNLLRRDLSVTDQSLTMEEFALPLTLNRQIALYADLTNVNGGRVSVQERMTEVQKRYTDHDRGYYNPTFAEVTKTIRPRVIVVAKTIEGLMK